MRFKRVSPVPRGKSFEMNDPDPGPKPIVGDYITCLRYSILRVSTHQEFHDLQDCYRPVGSPLIQMTSASAQVYQVYIGASPTESLVDDLLSSKSHISAFD